MSRVVSRLKERFEEWQNRALSEEVYAIVYLDGFHLKVRMAKRVISVSGDDPMTMRVDFRQSGQGWVAGFADYPVGEDAFYELTADYRALPDPLTASGSGLFISGSNHSDDLWMYYKGQIGGLSGDALYRVQFEVEIATPVPNGCFGVGGAPGEGVTVKAGASDSEPGRIESGGFWIMNVDKGEETNGGEDAMAIGDVANTIACGEPPQWQLKRLSGGSEMIEVTSDGRGAVWLFVGTDSGFEAITSVYYTQVTATFQPL